MTWWRHYVQYLQITTPSEILATCYFYPFVKVVMVCICIQYVYVSMPSNIVMVTMLPCHHSNNGNVAMLPCCHGNIGTMLSW